MNIEVTEKEAEYIYTRRHSKGMGKRRYLPLLPVGLILPAAMGVWVVTNNEIMAVLTASLFAGISIYLSIKSATISLKYAKSQIEGQK